MNVDLSTHFGPLAMPHPVMVASGCFAYGEVFAPFGDLRTLGGLVTKGISPAPRFGNAPPRMCETAAGMLNSIGLENVGVEAFLAEKLPYLSNLGIPIWVNFFGETFDEYVACAELLSKGARGRVAVLEMNVSCPNITKGGIEFGTRAEVTHRLVAACVAASEVPICVKLTPNVTDIVELAQAVREAGAVGVSLINTLTGMAVDVRTRKARLSTTYGGLSGPAIKPVALRMVHQVARALPGFPICAMGGIVCGEDVLEFLMAGACCVQVGTANFAEPMAAQRIRDELATCMAELGHANVQSVVGALEGLA